MRLNFFSLICVRVKGLLIRDPPFFHPWVPGEGAESCDRCVGVPHTARDTRAAGQRVGDQAYLCFGKVLMIERRTCVKSLKYGRRVRSGSSFAQSR